MPGHRAIDLVWAWTLSLLAGTHYDAEGGGVA